MFVEMREAWRAQLVGEDDDVRDAEVSKELKGRSFGERVESRRFAVVAFGNEARVTVHQRMPEPGGREHAVDIVNRFAPRGKWKARDERVVGSCEAVEDR